MQVRGTYVISRGKHDWNFALYWRDVNGEVNGEVEALTTIWILNCCTNMVHLQKELAYNYINSKKYYSACMVQSYEILHIYKGNHFLIINTTSKIYSKHACTVYVGQYTVIRLISFA